MKWLREWCESVFFKDGWLLLLSVHHAPDGGEVSLCVGMSGLNFEGFFKVSYGEGKLPLFGKCEAEIDVGVGGVGIDGQCFFENGLCFGPAFHF